MFECRSFLFLLVVFSVNGMIRRQYVNSGLSREKRTLIWPQGVNKLLAICGFGIPVASKPETSVIVGTVFKASYRFPANASAVTQPFVTYERKKRALNRWDLYGFLVQALEMRGFNGKSCLLRAICEVAQEPLVKNLELFHEMIHIFFTPTTTRENINHHTDNEYYAAQGFGKKNGNCEKIFKDCATNFLEVFTVLENEAPS